MVAVNGYFDGQNYVAEEQVAVRPNQRVIITVLDEDVPDVKPQDDARKKNRGDEAVFGEPDARGG